VFPGFLQDFCSCMDSGTLHPLLGDDIDKDLGVFLNGVDIDWQSALAFEKQGVCHPDFLLLMTRLSIVKLGPYFEVFVEHCDRIPDRPESYDLGPMVQNGSTLSYEDRGTSSILLRSIEGRSPKGCRLYFHGDAP
jgi:hypothetical protein